MSVTTEVNQKKALEMLLRNRNNEFKEIAQALNLPTTGNWEQIILQFCLQLSGCFVKWQDKENIATIEDVYKCFHLMRLVVKNNKMTAVTMLLNTTNKITEDFESIIKVTKE